MPAGWPATHCRPGRFPAGPRWPVGPGEEGEERAGPAQLIPVVEVIGGGIVEVDGQFDQPKSQHTGVEVEISLRVSSDRGDVMDPHGVLSGYLGNEGPAAGGSLSHRLGDLVQIGERKLEGGGPNPAIHLIGRPGSHDRTGDAGPGQGPGDGDRTHRGVVCRAIGRSASRRARFRLSLGGLKSGERRRQSSRRAIRSGLPRIDR